MKRKIIIIDATSRSIPYDVCLFEELQKKVNSELWISHTSVHSDILANVKNVKRLGLKFLGFNSNANNAIACLHCFLRLFIQSFFNRSIIIHFQWLPLYEQNLRIELKVIKILKKFGIKVIFTMHNVTSHEENRTAFNSADFNIFDQIIVHNDYSLNCVKNYDMCHHKFHVVPHGLLPFQKTIETRGGNLKNYFLLFGGVRKYKGVDDLINAWLKLEDYNKTELLIIGKEFDNFYKDYDLNHLEKNNIKIINQFVSNAVLDQFILNARFIIFPYKKISMSGALLKAIYAEKPVIVSNLKPFTELIIDNQNGIVYDRASLTDLISALKRAISFEKYDSLVDNQKNLKERYPTWSTIANITYHIYNNLPNR